MKRLSILAVVLILAVGCGSTTPTTPTGAGTSTVKFTAAMLPTGEVPSTAATVDGNAKGTATATLNITKDSSGTITAASFDFTTDLSGFPAGTTLTGAHIHPGVLGVNGSVLVSMGLGAGEIVLVNGAQVVTKTNLAVTAADAQSIINTPGNYYFNVHTTVNPGGAIRAQLVKQ